MHTGMTSDPLVRGGREDEGGVGGRRTSAVFVKATRRVSREMQNSSETTDPSSGLLVCVRAPFVSSA
jgi:hypothetical protein